MAKLNDHPAMTIISINVKNNLKDAMNSFKFKVFLLFLLTIVVISAQTSQMRIEGKPEKSTSEIVAVRDANGLFCAAIQVISDMEGFSYDSYNGIVKVDKKPGQDMVYISSNERVLEIFCSGYEPMKIILSEYGISLMEKQVWKIRLKLNKPIKVYITTNPENGEVYIDEKSYGSSGVYTIFTGQYKLEIKKDGYKTFRKNIVVNEKTKPVQFKLEQVELIPVRINSQPDQATIYIDSRDVGKTNTIKWLLPGEYEIRLTKEQYLDNLETVIIHESKNAELNVKLVKNVGFLMINKTPPDAVITIGKTICQETPIELPPGKYNLTINRENYTTFAKTIEIVRGQTTTEQINLKRNNCDLIVNCVPSDAAVSIDGIQHQEKEIILPSGEHRLNVFHSGYIPYEKTITLELNRPKAETVKLVKNSGFLKMTCNPADARILINREDFTGQNRIELPPGQYKLEISRDDHENIDDYVTIEIGKTITRSYKLEIYTGSLLFSIKPVEANVRLLKNGEEYGTWTGAKQIINLPVGQYIAECSLKKYRTKTKSITIEKDFVNKIDVLLDEGTVIKDDMVFVKGGSFTMGDIWGYGDRYEKPTHRVTVSDFYIGKYEVTQKQYKAIMGTNPSRSSGANKPVENVTWYEAVEFCNKLSEKEGLTLCYKINGTNVTCSFSANGYRLPTEAEWEYSARSGGRDDRKWSGTNLESEVGDYAWYSSNKTHRVGTKQPNDLGIYDMSGNVCELCWDWLGNYSSSSQTNPTGPTYSSYRARRGGSWYGDAMRCRTAYRYCDYPTYHDYGLGFRFCRGK